MYAQVTFMKVPLGQMPILRDILESRYLPVVRQRPGFKAAYLLEQADDPDIAQLVLFWDDHASVEAFNRTGLLQASIHALTSELPNMRVEREGYTVRLAVRAAPEQAATTG